MAAEEEAQAKKRSRAQSTVAEDELEIDLNLPEPPSKKAKRLAKKNAKAGSQPDTDELKSSNSIHADRVGLHTKDADGDAADQAVKKRSDWAIWIGNLEFSVTKDNLRAFLSSKGPIDIANITRINLPAPPKQPGARKDNKRLHKGFAYVDFADEESMNKAISLSEQDFAGRKVLIKNAKSFVGRPEVAKTADSAQAKSKHPPNKRVWVGNLAYDIDPDDLRKHFSQAGEVEDVSLMTWEDSGRCKGFGFVRFAELEAANAAVRGYITKEHEGSADQEADIADKDGLEDKPDTAVRRKKRPRKWYINRLLGRQLDVQYAEDSSTRYKKRYGREQQEEAVAL